MFAAAAFRRCPRSAFIPALASCITLALALIVAPASAITTSWTNAAGGNWNLASNWSAGIPGPADDAVITLSGTYTITLNVDATVGSLTLGGASGVQTLSATSRILTLNGASTVNLNGRLNFTSSTLNGPGLLTSYSGGSARVVFSGATINAPVHNAGTIMEIRGTTTFNGGFTNAAGSVAFLNALGGTANITYATGFTNNGEFYLDNFSATPGNVTWNVTSGTLVNAPGGVIGSYSSVGGGNRTINAQIENHGVVHAGSAALVIARASGDHVSTGTLSAGGADLTITFSGTTPSLSSSGIISAAAGRTVRVSQGGTSPSFTNSGTMLNAGSAGTLRVDNGFMTVAAGSAGLASGTLLLNSVVMTLNADLANSGSNLMNFQTCTVNGPARVVVNGTSRFNGSSVGAELVTGAGSFTTIGAGTSGFSGQWSIGGGTIAVTGESGAAATCNVALGFTNSGTLRLTSTSLPSVATLNVTNGSLVNAAGARIEALAGAGGSRLLNAQIDNQGTLETIGTGLTINKVSADHVSSGTIAIGTGTLNLIQSGTTPSLTCSGAISLTAGGDLIVDTGSWTLLPGATISGNATGNLVTLTSVTADFQGSHVTTGHDLSASSSTVTGGTLTCATGSTVTLTNTTINQAYVNQGTTRVVSFTTAINGALQVLAGSLLTVEGTSTFNPGGILTVANGFTNYGTIELKPQPSSATGGRIDVTNGTLVNAPGAIIRTLTSASHALGAQLDNQGTVSVGPNLKVDKASASHLNSGTINVSGGLLDFAPASGTASLTHSGSIGLSAGGNLRVADGAWTMVPGATLTGGGSGNLVTITRNTANFQDGLTTTGFDVTATNSTLGGGAFTCAGGSTVQLNNSTVNSVYVNQGTTRVVSHYTTMNGALQVLAGSLLTIEGTSDFNPGGQLAVANGFTNHGTIEFKGQPNAAVGGTLDLTNGTLINAPGALILASATGTRSHTLKAQLDNQGTVSVLHDLEIDEPSADHVNSGTIGVTGANLTIAQSGTTPSFTNCGNVSVSASRTLSSTAGSFINGASGVLAGAGTYSFGSTFTNGGSIAPGGILSITGAAAFAPNLFCPGPGISLDVDLCTGPGGGSYDRLAVSGAVTLDGVLNVRVPAGCCLAPGSTYRVLTAGSLSGTFDAINVTGHGNPSVQAQYDATGLTLVVVSNDLAITAAASAGGTISPAGAVAVACGGSQTFAIAPDACHDLTDVLVDGMSVGAVTEYTFEDVTEGHTISASFTIKTYALTASSGSGGAITPSGSSRVHCGTGQTYTITPDACFVIEDVLVDGVSVGAVSGYTFSNIESDHSISASFAPAGPYTIGASAGAGGSIIPAGGASVSCGGDLSFAIAPDACYHIADVLVDGVSVGAVSSYTFSNVTANHTIAASFALDVYSITASAGTGGSISPAGSVSVSCGSDQSFAIAADACYHVADVLVDGVSVGAVSNYTFSDVTANHTIAASFALDAYSITASAGAGGSISPAGSVSVSCGSDQSFAIAADACYHIADVSVDGVSVGAVSSYTFSDVTANHTIAASFALDVYSITASAGAGGSISPAGSVSVSCGSDQHFAIAADACYHIADVLVDGVSVGAVSSYTFSNVTANHTIAASFALDAYSITASAGAGGSIIPAGGASVSCGGDLSFAIAPDACYHIADVLVDGVSVGAVSSYTFSNVTANHTIAASFALDVYTINAAAGAGGSISPSGAVAVDCGADQSFVIGAAGGYVIADVNVDGSSVGAISSYTFTNVRASHTISASFFLAANLTVQIIGPPSGSIYPVNAPISLAGSFSGDASGSTHAAVWTIDGTSTVPGVVNEATGSVTGTTSFSVPGVYFLSLAVSSSSGQTASTNQVDGLDAMVVVYDPNGGFVTGGGWIQSPAGAYVANPAFIGKANFGFVSKYKAGATVPTGQTEFQFKTAGLNFHSSSYQWLVVAGAKAMYKGTGMINGSGSYGFLISAIDGDVQGGSPDKFRIKIWNGSNESAIVYDNQPAAADTASATTVIGGGSIVVHKPAPGGRGSMPNQAVSMVSEMPTVFALERVEPNPFRSFAHVKFDLPEAAHVRLSVFDLLGRRVVELLDRALEPGRHEAGWTGRDATGNAIEPGVYFVRLEARYVADGRQVTASGKAMRMR